MPQGRGDGVSPAWSVVSFRSTTATQTPDLWRGEVRAMSGSEDADALVTLAWVGDAASGCLRLIDQTKLPTEFVLLDCREVPAVWEAIKALRVRGAPAIGVAAAYGAVIGARSQGLADASTVRRALGEASAHLRTSRPTAVNLFWALDRMEAAAAKTIAPADDGPALLEMLLAEARCNRSGRPGHVPGDRQEWCCASGRRRGNFDSLQRRRAVPRPITVRPWPCLFAPTKRASSFASSPTRPGPCSKEPG